ncbi:hypothetical protein JTB14_001281 [Gonioctena quinquepunctata]|nr:hypothetical protein JTB14_001281 [Gonioctena quinquepunctata]
MEETTTSKLIKYKRVIEVDDFVDFLYSKKIITEENYYEVWHKKAPDRIHELFGLLHTNSNLDGVLEYLKNKYPEEEKKQEHERAYRKSAALGGFPKLPPNYVSRNCLVEEVKRKLLDLEWDKKLVIHGMMGYGKSCLVNEILSDSIVRETFDNCIFWIKLGDCHQEQGYSYQKQDALLSMWRLYTAASDMISMKPSHQEDNVDKLKQLLVTLFLDNRLSNSLLILDDADNENILSCFDIKCKTVITTQNKNILRNEDAIFVEVKTGFSRTESLQLFKKSLKIDYNLPRSADEIHNICQGHPMLIALIGSYLSENADYVKKGGGQDIWEYIKNKFLEGNYRLNEYNTTGEDILQMIKKCTETLLTNNLKDLYQDLAIFPQDVNIPPEVLVILWNKSPDEVRNIMNKFAEKSLIVLFYHKDFKTYIYGIHDIHLNYLKDITKNRSVQLHRKLLSGYDRLTDKNYANLPNDNYTLQFIGYHLYHGEVFDKFDIYLDLRFLGAKVQAVGKEDVLRDLHKYEVSITRKDNMLTEKLNHYKDFIQRCGGNLYSYEKTDIIQYALRENKDSHVFKDALNVAKMSDRLYFQLQKPCEELDYSQRINVKDDITSACFVDSPQNILIGTANGRIKLFYEQSAKEISNFIGHNGDIKSLIVSPDKSHFLSVSNDNKVMLWKFSADSARNSRDFTDQLPISPKTKQSYWTDMHTPDRGKVSPRKIFQVSDSDDGLISAEFCNNFPDTFRIITGSKKGNVIGWDARTGTQVFNTGPRGYPAPCVMYLETEGKNLVIFACQDDILIYNLVDDKPSFHKQLHNVEDCHALFASEEKFIAMSEKSLTQWKNNSPEKVYEISDPNKKNICSTLTVDNQYLVVSTDRNTVYIWDIRKKKLLREFRSRGLAKSLDTFYDEDRSVHILLIGSDRKTLQQCHIQPHEREPQTENVPVCTPYWRRTNVLTAVVSKENTIQVFSGYILISESEPIQSKVTCTCFSVCGNGVIYGLSNGEIHMFKIKSKFTVSLQEAVGSPVTQLKSYDASTNSYRYFRSPTGDSGGSLDSLDVVDSPSVVIVAQYNDSLRVYDGERVLERKITKPTIFYKSKQLIIVDGRCRIYNWDLDDDNFVEVHVPPVLDSPKMNCAAFSSQKYTLAVCYNQEGRHFIDVYSLAKASEPVVLREKLDDKVRSACFSGDGSLLAVGFMSGKIEVWNMKENNKKTTLSLHEDPVEELVFSPNLEPILVSVGAEIAWWNLRPLRKIKKKRGRPDSIDILDNVVPELRCMDFSYWKDRQPLKGTDCLLSCMKLAGKAKYVSASNDFNSFLTIDDNGKVYIMEIVRPDT